ncbi:hypothetical protein U9M48_031956, partial [Paspalum notatum var. saurae]
VQIIHELHTKKQNRVIFKIYFEKAYDKLGSSLCPREQCRNKSPYYQTRKGLRQGDPLSPILFNIVVDMLAVIITRANNNRQVKGVIPHLLEGGLSILQYVDDTIIFLDYGLEQAKHMKLILRLFEQLSGLKINFHKREIFCFGQAKEYETHYAAMFGCKLGSYPFWYLGLPMHFRKLSNKDWKMI